MRVARCTLWDESQKRYSGDWIEVDGVKLADTKPLAELEYARAIRENSENPAFHMRPMFHTGSQYAEELIALLRT